MSDDKKQKGKWHLLLIGVVLGSVITVGGFLIYPSDFNNAKKTVVNTVKNLDWGWTGFFGGTTTEVTRERKTETSPIEKFTRTTKYQPGKTFWDLLQLGAVPLVIAILGLWFQHKQDKREREIAQGNLAEEAIQKYLDNIAKLLLNEKYREELFPTKEDESILFLRICLFKLVIELGLHSLMRYVLSKIEYSQGYIEELFPTKDNPVRDVAKTQTITILRRLGGDRDRQKKIIEFLKDAHLYEFIFKKAHLSEINLSGAYLRTNLQQAYLKKADLKEADLKEANLQNAVLLEAKNLTRKQIKSACYWDKAIYKGEWHWKEETGTWVANNERAEQDNTNYIEKLKKDKSSDPKEPVDCTRWSR